MRSIFFANRFIKLQLLPLIFLILFYTSFVQAKSCEVIFFYSPTCPYCAKEKVFLDEMEKKHPELKTIRYDRGENHELLKTLSNDWNTIPVGVPRTFVGNKVFIGFSLENEELKFLKTYQAYRGNRNQIEQEILNCLGAEYAVQEEAVQESFQFWLIPSFLIITSLLLSIVLRKKLRKSFLFGIILIGFLLSGFYLAQSIPTQKILSFANHFSFPAFTFIIALVDGFNPCAFAVLAVLLSLLIYSHSRGKMALIGIIFILTSGIMYFLFIMILLTLRTDLLGDYQTIMRLIVGVIALVAGLINVKDFFWFKKGISLTIPEEKMQKLTKQMRAVTDRVKNAKTLSGLIGAIIATIILAALVNLIELGCTLILPVEYLEVLISNYGEQITLNHLLYTAFYCVVYIIPLLMILASFIYSFKSERISENQGRILKLISGAIMIALGLILIFAPEWLVF